MSKPTADLAPLAPPPGLPSIDRAPHKVPVTMGVAPTTLEEAWRLAVMISKSDEMIPKAYREAPEKILVAIQMGMEVGFAPMQALQSIAVIGGRPAVWGDGLLALVICAPVYQDHDEYFEIDVNGTMERRDGVTAMQLADDRTAAVATFVRRGKATPVTRRYSVGQARKAGYLPIAGTKGGKDGPWQTHPDRMLQMRARGFAARDAFPDVLRGMRTAEEVRDIPEDEFVDTRGLEAPARLVHRLSEQPAPPTTPPEGVSSPHIARPEVTELIGPVGIAQVEHLIGGPCAYLKDGQQVWLASDEDATDLQKFVGTDHRLTFEVVPVEDAPQQRRALRFALAE